MVAILPIILAGILSIVYAISDRYSRRAEKYHQHILSLGSGMFIALIFLGVFPSLLTEGVKYLGEIPISLGILLGLVSYHLVEKYAYFTGKNKKDLIKELGYLHVTGILYNNILDGFIIVLLFSLTSLKSYMAFLFFVPILLQNIVESVTLRHIDDKFKIGKFGIAILSLSIVFGSILATVLNLEKQSFYATLSVVTGIFLYFVIRDEIPIGRKGKPLLFALGIVIVLLVFFLIR